MVMIYERYIDTLKEDEERNFQELRWKIYTASIVILSKTGKILKSILRCVPGKIW
jgi:hypothetical protein